MPSYPRIRVIDAYRHYAALEGFNDCFSSSLCPSCLPTETFESYSAFLNNWIFASSATWSTATTCGGNTGRTMLFGYSSGNKNKRFAVTKDIDTRGTNSVVQFELGMSCGVVYAAEFVELQYSKDYGKTFQILYSGCYPGKTSSCSSSTAYRRPSRFYSEEFQKRRRVTIPIPSAAR